MGAYKLGIVGTAKNSGKTTVTAAIMGELRDRGKRFVLTSIGYDGEDLDNITGLPKPKLLVEPNDIIVTASKCMEASTASFETIMKTEMSTPLGKIMVNRVTSPGLAITAGPNKSAEVRKLGEMLQGLDTEIIIFDGALNRIAPIGETEGFVLATGAARSTDPARLAHETKLIWRISNLPVVTGPIREALTDCKAVALSRDNGKIIKRWTSSSLLSLNGLADFPDLTSGDCLYIPGIISESVLDELAKILSVKRCEQIRIIFSHAIKLLTSGDLEVYDRIFTSFEGYGASTQVLRHIPLVAVAVNPFYPAYHVDTETYGPAFIDGSELRETVQKNLAIPTFDVVKQGAADLTDIIMNAASLL